MASPTVVDFNHLTVVEAASLLQSGAVTSVQLVQHYIDCAGSHPELCAFAAVDEDGALTAAREADVRLSSQSPDSIRPLEGIPILIKENIHVIGLPNRAGTPALSNFIPTDDAPVVAALREAGAILYATSHMHELAWGISGYNPLAIHPVTRHIGTRNAYNVDCSAGGSSSGNGSALGARLALAALGTDTGGSVRIPASANGVCGLRPTFGRYPQHGITPCCLNRDTAGPMALTVADLELLDRIIVRSNDEQPILQPPALSTIRLGVLQPLMEELDSDTQLVTRAALDTLRAHGVQLIDVAAPELTGLLDKVGPACSMYEVHSDLAGYLAEYVPSLTVKQVIDSAGSEDVRTLWQGRILRNKHILANGTTTDLQAAGRLSFAVHRPTLQSYYTSLITSNNLTALVFPTTPAIPPLADVQSSSLEQFDSVRRQVQPGSLSGCPGITLPAGFGWVSGLPIGLALDGLPDSDRQLLAVGMALEMVLPRLTPPVWLAAAPDSVLQMMNSAQLLRVECG